jgi:plastocyanin
MKRLLRPTAAIAVVTGFAVLLGASSADAAQSRQRRLKAAEASATPQSAPAQEQGARTGTIRGPVVVVGHAVKSAGGFNPYAELYGGSGGRPSHEDRPGHLVVFLEEVPGKWHPPVKHAVLDQVDRQFTIDLLPVLAGTVVDFTNHDRVYHNVFTYSELQPFDLGRRARNETRSVEFQKLPASGIGVIKIGCEIHANMHSVILVMRNPFWAMVDANGGTFEITGVPPGEYTLTGWHDTLQPVPVKVVVEAGGMAPADITMKGE